MSEVPIIGQQKQLQISVAMLCTACFPNVSPAVLVFKGESICAKCFEAIKLKEKENNADGKE